MIEKSRDVEWYIQGLYLDVEAEILDEFGEMDFPPTEENVTLDYLADLAFDYGKKVVITFEDIEEVDDGTQHTTSV